MAEILRYDGVEIVSTPLDPLEDTISWLSGLRSKGYVSDVLRTRHGFADLNEIEQYTKLISTYAMDAVGLIQQAYAGPPEVSFLALYYSLLNLSKIYVALSSNRARLLKERHHGARYNTFLPISDLLGDRVEVFPSGSLGLFYRALTGVPLKRQHILLADIYPYIHGISHEYASASKMPSPLQTVLVQLKGNSADGFYVECKLVPHTHPKANDLSSLQLLERFNPVDSNPAILASEKVPAATEEQALELLKGQIKRFLLYDPHLGAPSPLTGMRAVFHCTPLSDKTLLLPEELPIWIAFFHLSNIVRYRPEFLPELEDSTFWAMLLALRRHALLRFLLLFWSYFHQRAFILEIA